MKQTGQVASGIRMVPIERIPDRLFVCSAKIKPEAGITLKTAFEVGVGLPKDLAVTYNAHLIYAYDLGEKGLYWEAGPSADFTEVLYILATDSLQEAQRLMHDDPFYKGGIFYDDWGFEWAIHSPPWKTNLPHRELIENLMRDIGILPKYPPGVKSPIKEIKVEIITPPKLFASFAKTNPEYQDKITQAMETGSPIPAFFIQHCYNRIGPGGTGDMGYDWESGPSVDFRDELSILSVNSLQMAQLVRENDPFTKHGLFYDYRYFEWCIHMPLRKASPAHKETLKRFLRGAGVKLAE